MTREISLQTMRTSKREFYTQPKFDEVFLREKENASRTLIQKTDKCARKLGQIIKMAYIGDDSSLRPNRFSITSNYTGEFDEASSADTEDEELGGLKFARCCRLFGIFLLRVFPFIDILRTYDIKTYLPNDLICGFTIGVMNIPQGMAYAMLATLPPVYGLYSSLFAPFIYFFFGTSRHLAMGTIAIVSLLTGGSIDRAVVARYAFLAKSNATMTSSQETAFRVHVAAALAITVGLVQLLMGVIRLGFVTRFLSAPMISGFTVASAFHVVVSQISTILGISIKKRAGPFNVPLKVYEICLNLPNTNLVAMGISLVSMAFLYASKIWVDPPVMKHLKVPIPTELIIVVVGGLVSFYMDLQSNHNLRVIGIVPSGLSAPEVPDLSLVESSIGDIIVISVIAFSICYSLASVYAKQGGYEIDSNQELVAYGLTNIMVSFMSVFPVSGSLSRTAVQVTMEGKTQIAGIFAAFVVLFVVLYAGPFFYSVPQCVLSSIILVALRSMFLKIGCLPALWKFSIWDFFCWVITFLVTLFVDVIYGLAVGIAFSIFTVILRSQSPKISLLGHVEGTEIFEPLKHFTNCRETNGVKVIRYEGNLYFACGEHFISAIVKAVGLNPQPIKAVKLRLEKSIARLDKQLAAMTEADCDHFDREVLRNRHFLTELPLQSLRDADGEFSQPNGDALTSNVHVSTHGCQTPAVNNGGSSDNKRARILLRRCCSVCLNCRLRRLPPMDTLLERKAAELDRLQRLLDTVHLSHIVLDCSSWNFIDVVGLEKLKCFIVDFNQIGVQVYLAGVSWSVQSSFKNGNFFKTLNPSILFVSVYDAVMWIRNERCLPLSRVDPEAYLAVPEKCSIIDRDLTSNDGDDDNELDPSFSF